MHEPHTSVVVAVPISFSDDTSSSEGTYESPESWKGAFLSFFVAVVFLMDQVLEKDVNDDETMLDDVESVVAEMTVHTSMALFPVPEP